MQQQHTAATCRWPLATTRASWTVKACAASDEMRLATWKLCACASSASGRCGAATCRATRSCASSSAQSRGADSLGGAHRRATARRSADDHLATSWHRLVAAARHATPRAARSHHLILFRRTAAALGTAASAPRQPARAHRRHLDCTMSRRGRGKYNVQRMHNTRHLNWCVTLSIYAT